MAMLQGRVLDPSGAAVPGASVVVRNSATGFTSTTSSDGQGRYHVPGIPAGAYQVTAEAPGFRSERIDALTFEVGRTLVRDFQLTVDTRREAVVVSAELPLLDRATSVVGHVVTATTVQEIPLNGRHFIDLGSLAPGSVAPSQTGFSSHADPRHRRAGVQYRRQPRRSGRLHRQRRDHDQHDVWIARLCAAGRQHPGVQDRQLDVQRRVRPRVGRDRQPGHALGHRPVPRRGLRILPSRRARRAQLLRVHHAGSASVRAPPVRRRVRRSDRPRPHVLLCHVRGPAPAPGYRHERRGAQRRPARGRDGSGGAAVDPADPARQLFRCRRHAAVRRRRDARVDQHTWTADARHNAGTRDRLLVFFGRQQVDGVEPSRWAPTFPASACGARSPGPP